jgi:hypothetical protein
VNFWTLLAVALAVLWLQANVIAYAALRALRAEARVRWEALLSLERSLQERLASSGTVPPAALQRWKEVLEKSIWPEDAAAVRAVFEARRLSRDLAVQSDCAVLELRSREAVRRYAEAAALYNGRIPHPSGWPLSKWMGFVPVEMPPSHPGKD